jgi:uncharacterized protein YhaN
MAIENARIVAKLEAQVETLELRLSDRSEENKDLRNMLARAQDALIAKEAPEAYRDQKIAEYEANHEMTAAEIEAAAKQKKRAETNSAYLEQLEQPLFKSPDEMIELLTRPQEVPGSGSLHENNES